MNTRNTFFVLALAGFFSLLFAGCSRNDKSIDTLAPSNLADNYPGLIPEPFGEGFFHNDTISPHSAPFITPDGKEIYFTGVYLGTQPVRKDIFVMRCREGVWSEPEVAQFCREELSEDGLGITQDGNHLYFTYIIHKPDGTPGPLDIRLARVDRTDNGWSDPVELETPSGDDGWVYCPIPVADGSLYYSATGGTSDGLDLYRARLDSAGKVINEERLPDTINSPFMDSWQYIDPAESFLMFCSDDSTGWYGLVISFRNDGAWQTRSRASMLFNGISYRMPSLSPDGKWLFLTTSRGIWWVDAAVVELERKGQLQPFASFVSKLEEEGLDSTINWMERNDLGEHPLFSFNEAYPLFFAERQIGRRNDLARELLRFTLERFPESSRSMTLLGEAYLEDGNIEAARRSFQRALSLKPDDDRAQRGLERLNNGR